MHKTVCYNFLQWKAQTKLASLLLHKPTFKLTRLSSSQSESKIPVPKTAKPTPHTPHLRSASTTTFPGTSSHSQARCSSEQQKHTPTSLYAQLKLNLAERAANLNEARLIRKPPTGVLSESSVNRLTHRRQQSQVAVVSSATALKFTQNSPVAMSFQFSPKFMRDGQSRVPVALNNLREYS